ncbi:MAG: DUF2283 domain-containing protein [Ignavibacteria bacterium]|nr:DUF2283 domain-containing protein [Ignavibacteria bacterium]
MNLIKLTIDIENNIAYMYLDESKKDDIVNTIELGNMNIDLSSDGSMVGIEFLNAKEQINTNNLKFAFQNMNTMSKPIEYELANAS